jgi:hydroxymethylpyrimidine pyrophosphatase-like HAD family hydrolase
MAEVRRGETRGLFVTDLDGTLLRNRRYSPRDVDALKRAGEAGWVRCVATGRNLYSARQAMDPGLPLDYLLFSTGAGVLPWPDGPVVSSGELSASEAAAAFEEMRCRALDFMVHAPVPDNHHFVYFPLGGNGPDFRRRVERYAAFARRGNADAYSARTASQLLAIVGKEAGMELFSDLRSRLANVNVIRTTSPLDGVSTWIEVFPAEISKGIAVRRLAKQLGLDGGGVVAVGNDYNDEDMLESADRAFVVHDAPIDLRDRFTVLESDNPICEALGRLTV